MTPEMHAQLRRLDQLRRTSWLIGAVLLVATPAAGYYGIRSWRLSAEVAARELDYGPLWRTRVEIEGLQRTRQALMTDQRDLLELSRPRPATALLACVAQAVARQQGLLRVREAVLDPLRPRPGGQTTYGSLRLDVEAREGADLDAFLRDLTQAGLCSAQLEDEQLAASPTGALRTCTIACRF